MGKLLDAINDGYEQLTSEYLVKYLKAIEKNARLLEEHCKKIEGTKLKQRDISFLQQYHLSIYNTQRELDELLKTIADLCSKQNVSLLGLESHRKTTWLTQQVRSFLLPLDPSILSAYVMEEEEQNEEAVTQQLKSMERNADALQQLCKDVSQQRRQIQPTLTKTPLSDIAELYLPWKEMVGFRKIRFETDYKFARSFQMDIDVPRLTEILDAILYHAIDELSRIDREDREVVFRILELDESVMFEIRDNCRNLSDEAIGAIFRNRIKTDISEAGKLINYGISEVQQLCSTLGIKMDYGNLDESGTFFRLFVEKH